MSRQNSGHDQKRLDRQRSIEIDEGLYSRQLYVLGHEAMKKMQASNILISGMGGLGVEIAKNIILGGVKSVTIHDEKNATVEDLATQFYLTEHEIGKNRAESSVAHLAELNSYVPVKQLKGKLTIDSLKQFQVVVLTDNSLEEQNKLGEFCHNSGIKFIIGETKGLFGKIFCDFGNEFEVIDVDGKQPGCTTISHITNEELGVVTTLDENRHGFEDGAFVKFVEVRGMTELNGNEYKIKVLGPYTFGICDTSKFGRYESGGIAEEVKKPKVLKFKPIHEASAEPEMQITDFTKMEDNETIHIAFQALYEFKTAHGRLPKPWNKTDADSFVKLANEFNAKQPKPFENLKENVLRLFSHVAAGELCPMQSVIGGMAAQEIMKACSGKFHPVVQYFYFDCREILPEDAESKLNTEECTLEQPNRYTAQIAVLGKQFQEKLNNLKYFLVGSGALGCEYLKNFAMIGVGCGKNGEIRITDMDTIEKSNLNRQFLFRNGDVGQPKSKVSARAAKRMNRDMNITPYLDRVGLESEKTFNDEFFEPLDGVCNALDNIIARQYTDRRCVYFKKPLIESGTLGTQANVQVVVPDMTESYSSTQDPPEKAIPTCTLKNFPYQIEHTIQWARDAFEGLFAGSSSLCVDYLKDPNGFIDRILKSQGHRVQKHEEFEKLYRSLVVTRPHSFEDCVAWARQQWQENYHNTIAQLLFNFPNDHTTTTGLPFWSGTKRCPHALQFDINNQTHCDFVYAAANLRAQMYGFKQVRDPEEVLRIARNVKVDEFRPKSGVVIHLNDSDANNTGSNDDMSEEDLMTLIGKLPKTESELKELRKMQESELKELRKMQEIEFEKDDDSNFHMDFIVATSNLRAENYDIAAADRHKTKLIAGRIIPAIATTTALIVGLDCIELYKLTQGHKNIELYRNSYINLAIPMFALSHPMPPKRTKYPHGEFTLWDRFEVKQEMTLAEFLAHFKTKHNLNVSMVSYDVVLLYATFISKAKLQERMNMKLTEIYKLIKNQTIAENTKSILLEISCDNDDGDDVDVPPVRYYLK